MTHFIVYISKNLLEEEITNKITNFLSTFIIRGSE